MGVASRNYYRGIIPRHSRNGLSSRHLGSFLGFFLGKQRDTLSAWDIRGHPMFEGNVFCHPMASFLINESSLVSTESFPKTRPLYGSIGPTINGMVLETLSRSIEGKMKLK